MIRNHRWFLCRVCYTILCIFVALIDKYNFERMRPDFSNVDFKKIAGNQEDFRSWEKKKQYQCGMDDGGANSCETGLWR